MLYTDTMIKESQGKYLSTLPEDKTITVKPFDPKVREVARDIIGQIQTALPGLETHFGGAAALGIAGQNDIDINILTTPDKYEKYSPVIEKIFGQPIFELAARPVRLSSPGVWWPPFVV